MTDFDTAAARTAIRAAHASGEGDRVAALLGAAPSPALRAKAGVRALALARALRRKGPGGLAETLLAEYGLGTNEGVRLVRLAEALLRTPDAATADALIADRLEGGDWAAHLGKSGAAVAEAATLSLILASAVAGFGSHPRPYNALRAGVRRLGAPTLRTAMRGAMKTLGRQFVLGQTIDAALSRAAPAEAKGWSHSYDMLGEAARTDADARRYFDSYAGAIKALSKVKHPADPLRAPGISVKLSALHPRYEEAQRDRAMGELVPRLIDLARLARAGNVDMSIDAEESDRLELSLDVISAAMAAPELTGWNGFGIVVQAYAKRAEAVLDWIYALAVRLDRRIPVRLVKGAYWDTEIKRAQVMGLEGFPVFTRKVNTDLSYLVCAQKLLGMTDQIYPQFATHNARTAADILEMADGSRDFEFQRLHGMGETLHAEIMKTAKTRCRVYAPVGPHRDLLAYLVRRLLENGANQSFVNQLSDPDVPLEDIAADPVEVAAMHAGAGMTAARSIPLPRDIFGGGRANAKGWDLGDPAALADIEAARAPFRSHAWSAVPLLAADAPQAAPTPRANPADPLDQIGEVADAELGAVAAAHGAARAWDAAPVARGAILRRAADLYETHAGELFALCAREAGKSLADAVAELREAVDFLRYYADQAEGAPYAAPRGVIACISPWNFPLAIFTGQVAAGLAAGNAVLAKPAEQTPLIAHRAVQLLHEAGVPRAALQFLPGPGHSVGAALSALPGLGALAFTGGTDTAMRIAATMAEHCAVDAPLIAETGGLNAMIVDSTALPEQAVRDVIASAFQSAGQRCSALRMLYVQEESADRLLSMLQGAMKELRLGNPWTLSNDIGPVIDVAARARIETHVAKAAREGRLIARLPDPGGLFCAPALIRVTGIEDLETEIFGPVLHVATYAARDLDRVIDAVNGRGYGLTFGLHTRIEARMAHVAGRIHAGNVYVNRNQIGAVVGSQPFGGEGLSGTGPKAGGPAYLGRLCAVPLGSAKARGGGWADPAKVAAALVAQPADLPAISAEDLPGPTGELNRLSIHPRGPVLCLGPGTVAAAAQAEAAFAAGCPAVIVAPDPAGPGVRIAGHLRPEALADMDAPIAAVLWWGDADQARAIRRALAARKGPITPLVMAADPAPWLVLERHLCVDVTAAGGDAALLAAGG